MKLLKKKIKPMQPNRSKHYIAFARYRISSHDLLIEKGRHFNIIRADRLCIRCHMNVMKLCNCHVIVFGYARVYNNLRKQYF